MNYTLQQTSSIFQETFSYIKIKVENHVLTLTLNRPAKKNAMNPTMYNEIAYALNYAHFEKDIWVVVIDAAGDIFCAGADLKAFSGEVEENNSTIPSPTGEVLLGNIFKTIHKPCIAKVHADVYAGGFFFLSGCHYVVANADAKFTLTEVKRGIYPFQVMDVLLDVMPMRKVLDWCMRGYSMKASEVFEYGLVTHLCTPENIDKTVDDLVAELVSNSPSAIRMGLEAYDSITGEKEEKQLYLKQMLQTTLKTKDAAEGIAAFKEKRKPNWTGE